jgi:hypothetical protein
MLPGRSVGDWSASITRRLPARADSSSVDDRLPQITLRPACSKSRRRFGRCLSNSRACAEVMMRTSQPPAMLDSWRIRERLRTSCHSPVRGASVAAVTSTAPVVPSEQTIFESYMLGLEPSSCSSTEQPGSAARMHTCAASSSLRTLAMTPSWWIDGRDRRSDARLACRASGSPAEPGKTGKPDSEFCRSGGAIVGSCWRCPD